MTNIDCHSYAHHGRCLHQAAPRRLFGCARCILWLGEQGLNPDPRPELRCKLQVKFQPPRDMGKALPRPAPPPPPARNLRP